MFAGAGYTVSNVYRPPIRAAADDAREDLFSPGALPRGNRSIVVGDFNAHHASWDPYKPEDLAGRAIEEWVVDTRRVSLNDGRATRRDLATGASSAPDLAIVGDSLAGRSAWTVLEDIGTDHLPILTVVRDGVKRKDEVRAPPRWKVRRADWELFAARIREGMADCEEGPAEALTKRFTKAVLKAAAEAVPRGHHKGAKAWWNAEVDEALRTARTRKSEWLADPTNEAARDHWREAERQATACVKKAKADSYEELLESLDLRKDPGGPFRLLKAMESPSGDPRDAALVKGDVVATTAKAKADIAIQHYAAINRLRRRKADDREIRAASRPARSCPGTCEYDVPFTLSEL